MKKHTFTPQPYLAKITQIIIILIGLEIIAPCKIPIVIEVSQQRLFARPNFKPYKIM